jgi:hypothetical protein
MAIENNEEKVKFLEKILKVAEENPKIITKNGRGIFYDDYPAFDEKCLIGLHIDEKGKAYFKIKGTVLPPSCIGRSIYNSQELLESGERYLRRDLDKFKQEFHLYKNRRENCEIDLLDKIR